MPGHAEPVVRDLLLKHESTPLTRGLAARRRTSPRGLVYFCVCKFVLNKTVAPQVPTRAQRAGWRQHSPVCVCVALGALLAVASLRNGDLGGHGDLARRRSPPNQALTLPSARPRLTRHPTLPRPLCSSV